MLVGIGATAVLAALALPAPLAAQQRPGLTQSGPVIQSTGQSVKVDDATFVIPERHVFKAVYVIDRADTTGANQQLTTIARFLNLHVRHGVPMTALNVFQAQGYQFNPW